MHENKKMKIVANISI